MYALSDFVLITCSSSSLPKSSRVRLGYVKRKRGDVPREFRPLNELEVLVASLFLHLLCDMGGEAAPSRSQAKL